MPNGLMTGFTSSSFYDPYLPGGLTSSRQAATGASGAPSRQNLLKKAHHDCRVATEALEKAQAAVANAEANPDDPAAQQAAKDALAQQMDRRSRLKELIKQLQVAQDKRGKNHSPNGGGGTVPQGGSIGSEYLQPGGSVGSEYRPR